VSLPPSAWAEASTAGVQGDPETGSANEKAHRWKQYGSPQPGWKPPGSPWTPVVNLWQVGGWKGTRNPLSSWRSAVRRGRLWAIPGDKRVFARQAGHQEGGKTSHPLPYDPPKATTRVKGTSLVSGLSSSFSPLDPRGWVNPGHTGGGHEAEVCGADALLRMEDGALGNHGLGPFPRRNRNTLARKFNATPCTRPLESMGTSSPSLSKLLRRTHAKARSQVEVDLQHELPHRQPELPLIVGRMRQRRRLISACSVITVSPRASGGNTSSATSSRTTAARPPGQPGTLCEPQPRAWDGHVFVEVKDDHPPIGTVHFGPEAPGATGTKAPPGQAR